MIMDIALRDSEGADGGSIKLELSFDRSSLRVVPTPFGVLLELEGCQPAGELGGPALPAKTIRVALPPGTEPKSVRAEALEKVVAVDGPVLPAPLQPARPGSARGRGNPIQIPCQVAAEKGESPRPERMKIILARLREEPLAEPFPPPPFEMPRQDLYAQAMEKPRPLASLGATEELGLNPIAVVHINPLQVNRKSQVELATRIELEIHYNRVSQRDEPKGEQHGDGTISSLPSRRVATHTQARRLTELARSLVVNPDWVMDLSKWIAPLITNTEYLVITDNFRWNAATIEKGAALAGDLVAQFRRLADWKRRRGLRTHVATVSDIVAGAYGDFRTGARDLPEVIRNFLKFAHAQWGVAWVLLGGDIEVIPVRQVIGYADGWLDKTMTDPPEVHRAFWTGSFMKLRSPGHTSADPLLNAENGLLIPYDAASTSSPTQRGWHFTTDETYTTRSTAASEFIRINGPAAEVNGALQWVTDANRVPTDLYYASLTGPNYGLPGLHDWDLTDNGFYGTHNDNTDMDGVHYQADVSVGRVPVISEAQAAAFVSRVIAYESFRRPNGTPLDDTWTRKMLIGAANWGGRIGVWPSASNPPGDYQAFHSGGASHTLLNTKDPLPVSDWRLLIQITETDIRLSPYNRNASPASRGWHFAKSAIDLSISEVSITVLGITFAFPVPTQWVVMYGPAEELTPQVYVFDYIQPDGSLSDQEVLRVQVAAELPAINNLYRLYEDEIDLTPAQQAAAPYEHLTEARMLAKINEGPHFVSLSGHGWWGGCCGYSINVAENASTSFHSYIAYADSCSTNQFDVDDAVSERSLYNPNGGAIAYLGNTRFSWIGVGDNFQRAFFHRLTTTRDLGLLADMRCALLNEGTGFWRRYNKWTIFALNLMGDPEMPVWVGPPKTLIARFDRELDNRLAFEVRVSRRGIFGIEFPLTGAVVTVSQDAFYRQGSTDAAGRFMLDISGTQLGMMDVTVTMLEYRPVLDTVEVVGPAWVKGSVNLISHQHVSPDSSYVRLALANPIGGDSVRGWFARKSKPDYAVILDALTDAYMSQKPIALLVASIKEGGTIEKFRFGEMISVADVFPRRALSEPALSLTQVPPVKAELATVKQAVSTLPVEQP